MKRSFQEIPGIGGGLYRGISLNFSFSIISFLGARYIYLDLTRMRKEPQQNQRTSSSVWHVSDVGK